MGDREAAIQAAISDIDAGVFLSQRAAAKGEDFLVQWILEEDARAFPPSHARAREMANRILRMNGDHRPVGKHWMAAFLKRNPRVASVVGRKIEAARAEGSDTSTDKRVP
ncbi:Transposase [Pyrenophora tritici-repentis]|nr:Transposase [Pyrenophora tritici-repentis]